MVTMPRSNGTQIRTFQWNGADLISTTNPENGTVTYQYDGAHHVTLRTDAKGQQTQYTYDPYGRLTAVTHATSASQMSQASPDVNYYYDFTPFNRGYSQNAWGRLAAVTFAGLGSYYGTDYSSGADYYMSLTPLYMYSYNQAGRVTDQHFQITQTITGGNDGPQIVLNDFDAAYAWDNQGRMTSRNGPDNNYSYTYDNMGRLSAMSGGANATAQYSAAGQIASMTYESFTETRTYNNLGNIFLAKLTTLTAIRTPLVSV
jgi:YD repeat-containing protein